MMRLLIGALALSLALAASADELAPNTAWQDAAVTLLDVDFPDTGFHGRWEFFHCECGDVLLRLEQTAPDGVLTGEMLLVDGQVLLARGDIAQVPDLEPMMQAPALMLQLALALINRALPDGPAAVPPPIEFDETEPRAPVDINTGMAFGQFQAPWQAVGKAWRAGPERRRFDLDFTFANPQPDDAGRTDRMVFNAGLDYGDVGFPLREETLLAGWRVQWMSRSETESTPAADDLTLAALRAEALAPGSAGTDQSR